MLTSDEMPLDVYADVSWNFLSPKAKERIEIEHRRNVENRRWVAIQHGKRLEQESK